MGKDCLMNWITVNDCMPNVGDRVWYFFEPVGVWQGQFDGYYQDEDGREWKGMHIFSNPKGWLTGDVTHWMPDIGQPEPPEPE